MKVFAKLITLCILCALIALMVAPAAASPAPQQNLLTNPGFEGVYKQQCCQTEPQYAPNTPYAEIQVAPGWTAWWREPDSAPAYPSYCDYNIAPETCQPYHRPEYREAAPFTERIRSGGNAQKYFTFYSIHEAGLYQQVTGVAVGQRYRFTVYMHAWSTNDSTSPVSSNQPSMGMQVGIDPNGGTDPFSIAVVWGEQFNAFDAWHQFGVDAAAKSSTITVFTRSRPQLAWQHNDVYVDDASLTPIGANIPPLATTAPSAPATAAIATSGPSPTPSDTPKPPTPTWPPTSTPLANGDVWYTVRPGDTLAVIAYYHQTTPDEIKRLNGLTTNTIFPGTKLLIKFVTPQPTVTSTPGATLTPSLTPELVQLPTGTPMPVGLIPDYGQLCVVAYNDVNGNAANDDEPVLPDVRVTLSVGETPLEGYVTTGSEQSHCFPQLPPGTYTISVAAPAGYTPTTASEATLQLPAGSLITLAFGVAPVSPAPAAAPPSASWMPILLLFVGLATGVMAAAGVAALVLARKK